MKVNYLCWFTLSSTSCSLIWFKNESKYNWRISWIFIYSLISCLVLIFNYMTLYAVEGYIIKIYFPSIFNFSIMKTIRFKLIFRTFVFCCLSVSLNSNFDQWWKIFVYRVLSRLHLQSCLFIKQSRSFDKNSFCLFNLDYDYLEVLIWVTYYLCSQSWAH